MENTATENHQQQDVRYVVHLVIPRKNPQCVVGEVLPDGCLWLPRVKLPKHIDCSEPGVEHQIDLCIEAELGIRGYVLRYIWNGPNTGILGADSVEKHSLLLVDVAEDQIVLQKPLKWISRDDAKKQKWMGTNGDERGDEVNKKLEKLLMSLTVKIHQNPTSLGQL